MKGGWSIYDNRRVGLSMAASWSWGVSLAVGISIVATRGVLPFAIWAVANIAAVPVFAYAWVNLDGFRDILRTRPIKAAMLGIQIFALWINMRILRAAFVGGDLGTGKLLADAQAYVLVVAIALVLLALVYRGGLRLSISTDAYQYAAQLVGTALIVGFAALYATDISYTVGVSEWRWAVVGALGLLAGPPLDAQQHQRIGLDSAGFRAGLWCAVFFGAYLVLVGVAGTLLGDSGVVTVLVAAVVLSISTSTLDSVFAALQDLLPSRRVAAAVALLGILSWYPMRDIGIVDFWSLYATARIPIVVGALVVVACSYRARLSRGFGA